MVLNLRKRAEYLEAEGTMIEKNKTDFDVYGQNQSYFFKGRLSQSRFLYEETNALVFSLFDL